MTIVPDADGLDERAVTTLLTRALDAPDGGAWVFEALRAVPGVRHRPAQARRVFHAAEPARLDLGEWTLSTSGEAAPYRLVHMVRGVALQTTEVGPAEAAVRLSAELLALARRLGSSVQVPLQSALAGIEAGLAR